MKLADGIRALVRQQTEDAQTRQEQQRETAEGRYAGLVRRDAAGETIDPAQAREVLIAAGKTPDDLERDVAAAQTGNDFGARIPAAESARRRLTEAEARRRMLNVLRGESRRRDRALGQDSRPGQAPTRDRGHEAERRDEARHVRAAVETLPDQDRCVIVQRYGLGDGETRTFAEIGDALGFTRSCARQIEARALRRLRYRLLPR